MDEMEGLLRALFGRCRADRRRLMASRHPGDKGTHEEILRRFLSVEIGRPGSPDCGDRASERAEVESSVLLGSLRCL